MLNRTCANKTRYSAAALLVGAMHAAIVFTPQQSDATVKIDFPPIIPNLFMGPVYMPLPKNMDMIGNTNFLTNGTAEEYLDLSQQHLSAGRYNDAMETIGLAQQTISAERKKYLALLLPEPRKQWKIDSEAEKALMAQASNRPVMRVYKAQAGSLVVVYNLHSPNRSSAINAAKGFGFSKNPDVGPVMIKGNQGAFYEYPNPAVMSYKRQLLVYVNDELTVSFASNDVSKDAMIKFADAVNYEQLKKY